MNPSYISQLFRKEVGETLTAYIARLRIQHAQELLNGDGDIDSGDRRENRLPGLFLFYAAYSRK